MDQTASIAFNQGWRQRATNCIAQGALTNSKRPDCFVDGVYPTHLSHGKGAHVIDSDGRKYIDFICGLGTNLLGYAHPEVTQAAVEQISKGQSLSLSTTLEVKVAEQAREFFPFVERVKFLKTGTEACMGAVRMARAWTNKSEIHSDGYHGWSDGFVSLSQPAKGVPRVLGVNNNCVVPFTRLESLLGAAGLIIEPVITDHSESRIDFLKSAKDYCKTLKVPLIFDEVITGFRYTRHSVSKAYGVFPDLILFGKAMANGFSLAMIGGSKEIMDDPDYFVSSTYAGETTALAAASKVMTLLKSKYDIEYLWGKGKYFQDEFNSIWGGVQIKGYPTRGVFEGEPLNKALFMQEACKAGLLFGPSFFFSFPHIELTDEVLSACKDVMYRIKNGMAKLEGKMPITPFAQQMRGTQ